MGCEYSKRRSSGIYGMKAISLRVNDRESTVSVDPDTPLLFVLNENLGLLGPRFGCGMAQCGACTVIIRGQIVRSCVKPVGAVGHDEVTTLEGLALPKILIPYSGLSSKKARPSADFA
jgi:aerobic-type carbon monoxide dehydrogenase small subunit (CoxS/CutS family)